MKLLCFFLFVASATGYLDYSDEESEKLAIVGGSKKNIKDVPYLANIIHNGVICCGAAIIADQWLVSAAHCFDADKYSVRTGVDQTNATGNRHAIEKIISHPYYNPIILDNDIALVKLTRPIKFDSTQQPITIAGPKDIPKIGELLTISGFGREGDFKGPSTYLKSAIVPIVDFNECKKSYNSIYTSVTMNMICAGRGPTDACQGDSGGPGVINGTLVAIISSGMECGSKTFPGIYTAVHKFHDWIIEHTGKLDN